MMRLSMRTVSRTIVGAAFLGTSLVPGLAHAQTAPIVEDFSTDRIGAAPKSFSTPTGFWSIGTVDGSKPLLFEDGTQWANANHGSILADQAKALYGDRWSEFVEDLPETGYFPLAVYNPVANFSAGTLSMRYQIIGGDSDQDFGILFNYLPNGDFMALRVDSLENTLAVVSVSRGNQSTLSRAREVPVAFGQWHDLQLVSAGNTLTGWVDGTKYIDLALDGPISGKIGVYAKTDTTSLVESYAVQPAD
jgi:hypothetical protein